MKKKIILLFIILLFNIGAYSTNLVGYIQGYNSYYNSFYPYAEAYIEFQYWNGFQWITGTYAYSGADGYYYFYNILPGYYYNLRINNTYNYQILVDQPQIQYLSIITL
jgi:hypothetical protein